MTKNIKITEIKNLTQASRPRRRAYQMPQTLKVATLSKSELLVNSSSTVKQGYAHTDKWTDVPGEFPWVDD